MYGKKLTFIAALAAIIAAALIAGCSSPSPTPLNPIPTAASPVPTVNPGPTLIGGSDQAHIEFYYTVKQYSQMYEGIPAGPGEYIYAIDVYVDSDKPVMTDDSWFSVKYQKNSSSPLITYPPATAIGYPKKTIGDGTGPAQGRLLIVLPIPDKDGYGPVPVYGKPVDEQSGTYKVSTPVNGVVRST